MKHFLEITDGSAEFLRRLLERAVSLREELKRTGRNTPVLERKSLAMVFEKPSLRTRVSFEVGMTQLGGAAINLQPAEIGLGTREPTCDVARVLGRMCDVIMARVFSHDTVAELAKFSPVPVINGLSDLAHPCQALADALTMLDHFGDTLAGRTVVYVGDYNNVTRSLAAVCGQLGMKTIVCAPEGYGAGSDAHRLRQQIPGLELTEIASPKEAVAQADVIYTDTWVSMGQEAEKQKRIEAFRGYTVDETLLAAAPSHAIVLHCLPAYRGLEISDGIMESDRCLVFPQAENRLHAQKALLVELLGV